MRMDRLIVMRQSGMYNAEIGAVEGISTSAVASAFYEARRRGMQVPPHPGFQAASDPTLNRVRCPRCGDVRVVSGRLGHDGYAVTDDSASRHCCKCAHRLKSHPNLVDKAWLESAYATRSTTAIAAQLGVSAQTVNKWLRRHGIPVRSNAEAQKMAAVTKGQRRYFGRNRQMVTGDGFADHLPGTVKHYEAG